MSEPPRPSDELDFPELLPAEPEVLPVPSDPGEAPVVESLQQVLGGQEAQPSPLRQPPRRPARRRRLGLPVCLFAATCLSTFFAGATNWQPLMALMNTDGWATVGWRQLLIRNWDQGLIYMGCVLAILLTHEMGHFVAALLYRVPASLPYFIPFPVAPIGTMGAVIGMEGHRANRRGIFDIGLAGPLAGLVAAAPILWLGIMKLDLQTPVYGELYDCPLLIKWTAAWLRPEYAGLSAVGSSQLNPYFMAGWVGLLITGLNMLPVSQLDGGHVVYALLGRRAHWIARGFILLAITYIVVERAWIWTLMLILVMLIGPDHPPTSNDRVRLGWFRYTLGFASLVIPILCFPPRGIVPVTF
jgi:Zn-dependent protease